MIRALNTGASFIFVSSEGMKNRATASDTDRLIITTAAKSDRVTLEASSRKKITAGRLSYVREAARSEMPTFRTLLPYMDDHH